MSFQNKTVVITGCNKGIGLETLKFFFNSGADIIACVRTKEKQFLEEVKNIQKNKKNKIILKTLDLSKEEDTKKIASEIISEKNKIDILINNAGTIQTSLFQMSSIKNFKRLFDVNFFNQVLFTQIILKSIIRNKKGNIIFLSSSSATDGNIGRSIYSTSKGAINSLTKTLSKELGRFNIRVNAIAPGLVDTDMANDNTEKSFKEDYIKLTSLNRVGNPKEIASIILSVCSDENSFLTGQIIRVDGGI